MVQIKYSGSSEYFGENQLEAAHIGTSAQSKGTGERFQAVFSNGT